MRSIVISQPGSAATLEREIPTPGKGEALLKMLVGGVCGSDLASYRGQSAYVSYPRTIGHEFAAQVDVYKRQLYHRLSAQRSTAARRNWAQPGTLRS